MTFPLNVYVSAFVGAMLVSYFSLPVWRRICFRAGLVDEPGGRKQHGEPTPLAGGFAVLSGMLLPLLAGVLVVHWQTHRLDVTGRLLSHGLDRRGGELGGIVSGAIGMLLLGILDDKYELRAVTKLAGQLAVALLVAAAGVRITLFVHNLVFSYFITILWILTVTNAFNFMDNMNGLCVGLAAIGSWNFAVIAGVQGQYLAGVMGLLMCGALLGFLPHNFPRASAFLGDAGSHLAGYLLAVMAILPHFYNRLYPHHAAVLIPLLVLAVPLGDLGWVVCLRWREGQPVYVGDHNHLSHRLVKMGHSQRRSVLEIWLLAVVLGALAVFLVLF